MISRTHPIMTELKDEDKWLKFFTIKQLIYYAIAIVIGILATLILKNIHLEAVGFVMIIVNIAIAFLLQMKIPESGDKYIIGAGMPLQTILFRLLKKLLPKNRVIYVKNYDSSIEGAMERAGKDKK